MSNATPGPAPVLALADFVSRGLRAQRAVDRALGRRAEAPAQATLDVMHEVLKLTALPSPDAAPPVRPGSREAMVRGAARLILRIAETDDIGGAA